jgi:cell division protein ZapA
MGQVAITLNDRIYRLVCDDGEEDRLVELAGYIKLKVDRLRAEVGHVGDERLVLMAALQIADELFDALGKLEAADGETAALAASDPEPVRRLKALADELGAKQTTTAAPTQPPSTAPAPPTAAGPKPRRRDVA